MKNNKSIVILIILIIFTIAGIMILDQYEDNKGKVETGETTTTEQTTEQTTKQTTKVVKTTTTTKKTTKKMSRVATASKQEYMAYAKQKGGYNDTQMQCLDWLWTHESKWDPNSYNEENGVCGIPQAYKCSIAKYYGTNTWEHQIMWGVDYICREYNCNPCKAWNHYKNSKPHGY